MALADNETLADKSGLEFVTSHCNEPFIALRHLSPAPSSLLVPCSLFSVGAYNLLQSMTWYTLLDPW